jgi:alkylated DNA repair dioxygenase AlkB
MTASQQELFPSGSTLPELPEGFVYQPDFITRREESALLEVIRDLPLEEARYKEFTARRRTVSYGFEYDFSANRLDSAPAIPAFLLSLRDKVAALCNEPPANFIHALVTEYPFGTPLGWHRDVPQFELIAGVSLYGPCRMKLRPYRPGERNRRQDVIDLDLAPRSAYIMRGPARWAWQHSVAATKGVRYSITLRTARARE